MADPVICAMATFPPRKQGMLKVLAALLPQCDKFYLYLNLYDAIPSEIYDIPGAEKLNVVPGPDLGSQAKLYWMGQDEGYYLTVDDDMIYPSDYVARMVRGVDKYGGLAIVTAHGSLFRLRSDMTPQPVGAMQDNRLLHAYDQSVPSDRAVHMCGNACTACMPRRIGISSECRTGDLHSGDDADIAVWAQQHRVPIIRLQTPQKWIQSNHSIGIIEAWHRRPDSRGMTNAKLRTVQEWRLFPLPPIAPGFEEPAPVAASTPKRLGTHLTTTPMREQVRCSVTPRLRSALPVRPGTPGIMPRARIGAKVPVPQDPSAIIEPDGNIIILWATARPDTFRQTHKAWMDAAVFKHKIRTYVAVDTEGQREQLRDFNCIVTHNARPGVCFPCFCLTQSVTGKDNDIIVFASDDFFPPQHWDSFLAKQLNHEPARLLIVNDGIQHSGGVVTIPILNYAGLLQLNRVIYHPAYKHMWSDVELYDVASALGMVKDIRGSEPTVFEHRHFIKAQRPKDAIDMAVAPSLETGRTLYQQRTKLSVRERLRVDQEIVDLARAADAGGVCRAPVLSVLICTTSSRKQFLRRLLAESLYPQLNKAVEILVLCDAGERSIGMKRNELLDRAAGAYVCFVDDDDTVSPDYVAKLLEALASGPDCCSIEGVVTTDGRNPVKFVHSLKYDKWGTVSEGSKPVYVRCPNHLNPVRRDIALRVRFPDKSHGEDRDYSLRLRPLLKVEKEIKGPVYYYMYRSTKLAVPDLS